MEVRWEATRRRIGIEGGGGGRARRRRGGRRGASADAAGGRRGDRCGDGADAAGRGRPSAGARGSGRRAQGRAFACPERPGTAAWRSRRRPRSASGERTPAAAGSGTVRSGGRCAAGAGGDDGGRRGGGRGASGGRGDGFAVRGGGGRRAAWRRHAVPCPDRLLRPLVVGGTVVRRPPGRVVQEQADTAAMEDSAPRATAALRARRRRIALSERSDAASAPRARRAGMLRASRGCRPLTGRRGETR